MSSVRSITPEGAQKVAQTGLGVAWVLVMGYVAWKIRRNKSDSSDSQTRVRVAGDIDDET